jgi:hypothetical protein
MWIDPASTNQYPNDTGQPAQPYDPNGVRTDTFQFQPTKWGADFVSLLALVEFSHTGWESKIVLDPPNFPGSAQMKAELQYLIHLQQTARPTAFGEIVAQDQTFQWYITAQMGVSPGSQPNTYLMLKMAARIGELVMVKLKRHFNQVRPSQIYPALLPPVDVAPHASYPSGHSLCSHLIAYAGAAVVPPMATQLALLANRISHNREIGGMHFPSDTVAGQDAAAQAFKLFQTINLYKQVLPLARREWS